MKIRLQSILQPTDDICKVQELYYHQQGERIDFDGYFNLFYIEKRKAYTIINRLFLSLHLKGYRQLFIMHDQKMVKKVDLYVDQEKEYLIEFPYAQYDTGVFWFSLLEEKGVVASMVEGGFYGESTCAEYKNVNLGIDICTYRREPYVIRNLRQIKKNLLEQTQLEVSSHIRIYIIDNGNTLSENKEVKKIADSCEGRVQIIPNRNAGGAGGFTRGMLEVIEEKERFGLTHILLMDDDAVVEPDSLVRTYGVLCTLKDEWKDMTVGGVMMREDYPYRLHCAGEGWKAGVVDNPMINIDVRKFEMATLPHLLETGHEHEWYSGWWYCCYSLNTVRKDNLPIPLFIHHDDIEFCLRNTKQGIVFLNGIGVWHRALDLAFPGVNLYYDVRNNLIEFALNCDKNRKQTAEKIVLKMITLSIVRMRYQEAELVYRGVLDFLRGPKWLHRQNPEKLHNDIRAQAYSMRPVAELISEQSPEIAAEIEKQLSVYEKDFEKKVILEAYRPTRALKAIYYFTYGGWILPCDKSPIKVIASTDSPFIGFRKRCIFLYEPGTGKGSIVKRNYKEIGKVLRIYVKTVIAFQKYFDPVCMDYQEQLGEITSKTAWKEYLGL